MRVLQINCTCTWDVNVASEVQCMWASNVREIKRDRYESWMYVSRMTGLCVYMAIYVENANVGLSSMML